MDTTAPRHETEQEQARKVVHAFMNSKPKYDFLARLGASAIRQEKEQLNAEILGESYSPSSSLAAVRLEHDLQRLERAGRQLESDPLGTEAPGVARKMARAVEPAEEDLGRHQFLTRIFRLQIMRASAQPWIWVDYDIAIEVKRRWTVISDKAIALSTGIDLLCTITNDDDWLDVLMKQTILMLDLRLSRMDLQPDVHHALRSVAGTPYKHFNGYTRRNFTLPAGQDDFGLAVVTSIRRILPSWLGFQRTAAKEGDRPRAWVVRAIEQQLGSAFLTTSIAWRAFIEFRSHKYIKNDRLYRVELLETKYVQGFVEALRKHPISQDGTEEQAEYLEYGKILMHEYQLWWDSKVEDDEN